VTHEGGYALLDHGRGRKLELLGPLRIDRQAGAALWPRRLAEAEWLEAHAVHHRVEPAGGRWEWRTAPPDPFVILHAGLHFEVRLTDFGHFGLFPEHATLFPPMEEAILEARKSQGPVRVLNLFAHTGAGTLVCARAGAEAVHVDASRTAVAWARRNAALNGLESHPVRWIVEDALRWVEREARRGQRYEALILDPPSFGRGARGEVWKIEDQAFDLLQKCRAVLPPDPLFVTLTAHTPGFTPLLLASLLAEACPDLPRAEACELQVRDAGGRPLPAGAAAIVRSAR
jgi:23S rRNA (cytosine1962-C5)-methyltransferase